MVNIFRAQEIAREMEEERQKARELQERAREESEERARLAEEKTPEENERSVTPLIRKKGIVWS